jgi:hypothetical protein
MIPAERNMPEFINGKISLPSQPVIGIEAAFFNRFDNFLNGIGKEARSGCG